MLKLYDCTHVTLHRLWCGCYAPLNTHGEDAVEGERPDVDAAAQVR